MSKRFASINIILSFITFLFFCWAQHTLNCPTTQQTNCIYKQSSNEKATGKMYAKCWKKELSSENNKKAHTQLVGENILRLKKLKMYNLGSRIDKGLYADLDNLQSLLFVSIHKKRTKKNYLRNKFFSSNFHLLPFCLTLFLQFFSIM